jgi:uncharacterized glyoxalase superfamily protein PhnB
MSSVPVGDVYPSLIYDDAKGMIDWLCRAFGFTRRLVVPGPDDRIEHSELTYGGAVIMVASPNPDRGFVSPRSQSGVSQALSIRVEDPDAHYATAMAAGSELMRPLTDEAYGSRGYMAKDPGGHVWYFGTYRPGAHWGEKS